MSEFKTQFAESIFHLKFPHFKTWKECCRTVIDDVCKDILNRDECEQLFQYMLEFKFVPAGRYLYYAGKPLKFFNNCYCFGVEDTREGWGDLLKNASDALMSGGGIGVNYSKLRCENTPLKRSGGVASGSVPLMCSVNEIGRNTMRGGGGRSAGMALLNWQHGDVWDFLQAKDWSPEIRQLKDIDPSFPAPLDMTNISIEWDNDFTIINTWYKSTKKLLKDDFTCRINLPELWYKSVKRMCKTGEPGHTYNLEDRSKEIYRNACGEYISDEPNTVCNLGSINLGAIEDIYEVINITYLASKFLYCGTIRGHIPIPSVKETRDRRRDIGLGIMGAHEWLLKRGYSYKMNPTLRLWLNEYQLFSMIGANELADKLGLPRPIRYRAVAPAGTISILASTTAGIEPLYAIAYKQKYLNKNLKREYQYVVDSTAERVIKEQGVLPENIETAHAMAGEPEKRIRFQSEVQEFVDMGISSTLNLEKWGSERNNPDTAVDIAQLLAKYCYKLRGITIYPDGGRGGQPFEVVDYDYAKAKEGVVFNNENNLKSCDLKGGCNE